MLSSLCRVLNAVVFVALCSAAPTSPVRRNVLYIPGWAQNLTPGRSFFNISGLYLGGVTHINYAFAHISDDFTLYYPYENQQSVFDLKRIYPNISMLISIGGGGFSTAIWSRMASSSTTRRSFIASVLSNVATYSLDGIDLDWEFPGPQDKINAVNLLQELRAALAQAAAPGKRLLLTAAVTGLPTYDASGMDVPAWASQLDFFNVMTYDMHDPCYWESSTSFHTAWSDCVKAINQYKAWGVPPSQLVLGLAFYGHTFMLKDAAASYPGAPSVSCTDCDKCGMNTPSYRDIVARLSQGEGRVAVDTQQRSAYYVSGTTWVGFETPETIALKVQGASALQLGGVMSWSAELDTRNQTLLRALAAALAPQGYCGGGSVGNSSCNSSDLCCSSRGYCGAGAEQCGPGCLSGPCLPSPPPAPAPPPLPPPCGRGNVSSGQCSNPQECCSQYGWCGVGSAYCGGGCKGGPCWTPPSPSIAPPSPNDLPCGEGKVNSGRCLDPTHCCSQYGWCWNDDDHCGADCVGGPCYGSPSSSPSAPPSPSSPPSSPSNDLPCGEGAVNSGRCEDPALCCSSAGWCWNDDDHCGENCVGGPCYHSPSPSSPLSPPSPPSNDLPCGEGKVNNGHCENPAFCCSSAGWCWNDDDHCGEGCVGGPCYNSPSPLSPVPSPFNNLPCGEGVVNSGRCQDPTLCCSSAGWCWNDDDHCGANCVGGPCYNTSLPPPNDLPCGNGVVNSGRCTNPNQCCSKYGWCWYGDHWCGEGCQGGPCYAPPSLSPSSPPPSNDLPCGGGKVNSGRCLDPTHCCSKYGWCWVGDAWCGDGCISGPCYTGKR